MYVFVDYRVLHLNLTQDETRIPSVILVSFGNLMFDFESLPMPDLINLPKILTAK